MDMSLTTCMTRLGKLYLYGIFASYALVILLVHHAPLLQDYPDWVYQGVLFQHTLAGHTDPGYVLHHYPVPNSLTTVMLGLLNLLFGWQLTAKIWIIIL